MNMLGKLIVITGPTASGKSAFALKLAEHTKTAIVCADSRQVYREMNIGTNKPSLEEQSQVPHYLLDLINPDERFSAARYAQIAESCLKELFQTYKIVLLVGGTGLYIQALLQGLDAIPESSEQLRQELQAWTDEKGLSAAVDWLRVLDPISIQQIDTQNPRRVLRALEVCLATGNPFSSYKHQKSNNQLLFEIRYLGMLTDREELIRKIEQRTNQMLDQGLIRETQLLIEKWTVNAVGLQTIGYAEAIQYLNQEISLDQCRNLINTHTRQYAKRQMTWFRKNPEIEWVLPTSTIKDF